MEANPSGIIPLSPPDPAVTGNLHWQPRKLFCALESSVGGQQKLMQQLTQQKSTAGHLAQAQDVLSLEYYSVCTCPLVHATVVRRSVNGWHGFTDGIPRVDILTALRRKQWFQTWNLFCCVFANLKTPLHDSKKKNPADQNALLRQQALPRCLLILLWSSQGQKLWGWPVLFPVTIWKYGLPVVGRFEKTVACF